MVSVPLGDDPCTGRPSLEAEPFDRVLCCPARSGGTPTPLFHFGTFPATQVCCSYTLKALGFMLSDLLQPKSKAMLRSCKTRCG